MEITRRMVVGGFIMALFSTAIATLLWNERRYNHVIIVANERDSSHDVTVETKHGGSSSTYGPRRIESGDQWEVTTFTSSGTVSATFDVDGSRVWETTHEIPTTDSDRSSIVLLELLPDGEVRTRIKAEE